MTRAEWEAQRYSNEPYPPWSLATWGERGMKVLIHIACAVFGTAILFVIFLVLGEMMDVAAERSVHHDRCLKQATNGYEIQHCN